MKKIFFYLTIAGLLLTRLVVFSFFSPSLYWDEVALAYDSWSLATNWHDYHHHFLPLVAVESFGDYKPSGYFYVTALLMKVFGPADWVVRLPSFLAGIAIAMGTGVLLQKLLAYLGCNAKSSQAIAILVAMGNPAIFHLSLAAWETHLATAFFLWGIILLFPGRKLAKLSLKLLGGQTLLIMSFYTYHSMRIIAPVMGIFCLCWQLALLKKRIWQWQNLGILSLMLLLALISFTPWLWVDKAQINQRFKETSIFSQNQAVIQANQCLRLRQFSWWSKIFCHRYRYYMGEILHHYFDHFSLDYLFLTGEANRRHATGLFGIFYPFELLAFFWGMVYWWRQKHSSFFWQVSAFLLLWLLLSVLPASLTVATPHLLRSFSLVPLGIMMIAWGWQVALKRLPHQVTIYANWGIGVIYGVFLFIYVWHYTYYYLPTSSSWWQFGYKQAIEYLGDLQKEYPQLPVGMTRNLGRPSMYYFWFNRVNPLLVQAQSQQEKFDQGEYLSFSPHRVTFGGLIYSQKQLLLITPEELAALPSASLEQKMAVTNATGQEVLLVGLFQPSPNVSAENPALEL